MGQITLRMKVISFLVGAATAPLLLVAFVAIFWLLAAMGC